MIPRKIINKALIDRDLSQVSLARRIGRSREAVVQAIRGEKRLRPTRALIAEALDIPYDEVWTDE